MNREEMTDELKRGKLRAAMEVINEHITLCDPESSDLPEYRTILACLKARLEPVDCGEATNRVLGFIYNAELAPDAFHAGMDFLQDVKLALTERSCPSQVDVEALKKIVPSMSGELPDHAGILEATAYNAAIDYLHQQGYLNIPDKPSPDIAANCMANMKYTITEDD